MVEDVVVEHAAYSTITKTIPGAFASHF